MNRAHALAALIGVLCESLAALWLIGNPGSAQAAALALLLHVCAALALALWGAGQGRRPALAVLALAVLLPAVGPLLYWSLRRGGGTRHRPRAARWAAVADLDPHRRPLTLQDSPTSGALQGTLRHNPSLGVRLRAVERSAELPPRAARSVLDTALRDPAHCVRERAFARLDGRHDVVDRELGALLELMEREPTDLDDTRLQAEAADRLWEMSYRGLADKAMLPQYLHRANAHLARALALAPTEPGLHYQRGRILLKLGRAGDAERAFERAAALGQSADVLLPYLAECAFDQGHYRRLPELLGQLSPLRRRASALAELCATWGVA